MNTKNLLLIALLAGVTTASLADTTTATARSGGQLPASPVQAQVLAIAPPKTAEFARFEVLPVKTQRTAPTYRGIVGSPNQLEVLGKKIK